MNGIDFFQTKLLESTALEWGYEAEKIVGFKYSPNNVFFRVKLKGVQEAEIVPQEIMCREHPEVF